MDAESGTTGPQKPPDEQAQAFVPATGIPLFHAAWLFALGVALAHIVWLRPSLVLVALSCMALLCVLAACRAQRVVWLPLAVLWCLLGAWSAEMAPQPAPAPQIAALSDGLLRTVEGVVREAGPVRDESSDAADTQTAPERTQSIDLAVTSIEVVNDSIDAQKPAQGGVRLTMRWLADSHPLPLACGERIRATVQLRRPTVYRDPGAWNRADYLLQSGITSTASAAPEHVERLGMDGGASLHCRIAAMQHAFSSKLMALPEAMRNFPAPLRLSQEDAIMLAAMTTGDRTYLTHTLRVGFERTGSFHMLVVSGFHLAVVAGCFFWVARKLRFGRVPSILLTLGLSLAYALFTGFAVPVQRSLWMVALYLVGRLFFRDRNPLNTIGFAALGLLILNPRSLFGAGLQMTLLAVVAIAGIAAPLLEHSVHPYLAATRNLSLVALDVKLAPEFAEFRVMLRMIATRLHALAPKRAAWDGFPWAVRFVLRCVELLAVSCVVELAMALPMAIYFHRITLFALPVNMLILPLLTLLLPVALMTTLLLAVSPAAAAVPAAGAAVLLHFGVWIVHLFGSLAMGDLRIPGPVGWQIAAFLVFGAAAMVLARGRRWAQRAAWACLAVAAIAAVLPRAIDHPHDALLVEALDVGQGDSLLVITPDGRTMLVDGGGFGGGPRAARGDFDIGEEVVSPALWARGIRRLDVVALSHAHSDHMGGLPAVLRNFRPAELWVGNNPPVADYRALLEEATQLGISVHALRAGDSLVLGSAQINVLAPMRDYTPKAEPGNNDSLVLHVASSAGSVLLEGDAEKPIEEGMLQESGLQSTLLKIAHHGSATSTQPDFLGRVAPRWALISCGLGNSYGHPRREVLAELEAAHVRTLSTDIHGAVCFTMNEKTVTAESMCGLGTR